MSTNNQINGFVIPANKANVYNLIYTGVDGGRIGCDINININGVDVQVGSGSTIDILIKTVSGGFGCYLYGDYPDVYGGVNTPFGPDPTQVLIDSFISRVNDDSGVFEAESCLFSTLSSIDINYNQL